MYQGHHFTSFVGSVRDAERQGQAERLRAVQEANRTPLPAPTPAGQLFARWEASRAPPAVESPRAPRTAQLSTAQSRGSYPSNRSSMVASSRGPHSARVASRLESARRELAGLTELQQAREVIKQLRSELGLPFDEEQGVAEGGEGSGGGGGGEGGSAPAPGTSWGRGGSPAKRRPFPPTDIFPNSTGGDEILWYQASEFKTESQKGPRVGGRRQPLATSWRG